MTFKQHICDAIPTDNDSVIIYLAEDDKFWKLHVSKLANEEDLEENHHLELIDETIWQTRIEILYCPYCGKKLEPTEDANPHEFGHYQHYDFSKWS